MGLQVPIYVFDLYQFLQKVKVQFMNSEQQFLALLGVGSTASNVNEKKSSSSSLLSGIKAVSKAKKQEEELRKKEQKEKRLKQEEEHEYLKLASKPIKKAENKTILFAPSVHTDQEKKYERQIQEAKKQYEIKSSGSTAQKLYTPKVVNYFADEEEEAKKKNKQKQRQNNKQKNPQRMDSQIRRQEPKVMKQVRQEMSKRQNEDRERSRQRKVIEKRREDPRYSKQDSNSKNASSKYSHSNHCEQRSYHPEKSRPRRRSPSPQQQFDWKKQLNKITQKDKKRELWMQRDKMEITEATTGQMLGEDRRSARFGRMQEEQDMRREMEEERRRQLRRQKLREQEARQRSRDRR